MPPFPILMQGPEKIAGRYVAPRGFWISTIIRNLTGQPAATVPGWIHQMTDCRSACRSSDAIWTIAMVLRASGCFEAVQPWRDQWPPIVKELGL